MEAGVMFGSETRPPYCGNNLSQLAQLLGCDAWMTTTGSQSQQYIIDLRFRSKTSNSMNLIKPPSPFPHVSPIARKDLTDTDSSTSAKVYSIFPVDTSQRHWCMRKHNESAEQASSNLHSIVCHMTLLKLQYTRRFRLESDRNTR